LDFYQCRFEKAYQVFAVLAKQAESIYIKIAALFYMCLFPALYQQDDRWNDYCLQFNRCFENEFPHKKDMELFLPWLDMLLGQYFAASEKYQLDKEYSYDKSVRYLNACLSIAGMLNCDNTSPNLDSYEILCKNMEEDGYLYEALELHLSLFWTFMVIANEKSMLYHLNKAIKIAYDRRLIFPVANYAPYYSDIFDVALKEYPGDFGEKVRTFGDNIHNNYSQFTKKNGITDLYAVLTKKDYRLLMYAGVGYSYKQVADILHLSERTVAVKYAKIFDKLNISNKRELRKMLLDAWGKKDMTP